ncbi:MAG: guanylate kinase [Spirochaetes bacterium]|nr:guanylate kinase [Spirochaetota bacterium]
MQKNDLVLVVSAPSGAGKTTIINKLLSEDDRFEFVISTTTRPPRNNEQEGSSYYFVSIEDFQHKIEKSDFFEWAEVHKNYYGVTKKEFDRILSLRKIPLFDVDVQGAKKLKEILGSGNTVFVFISPPSIEGLRDRLKNRGTDSEEVINLRIQNAVNELNELNNFDYLIVNNDIDESLLDLKAIMRAEFCKIRSK